MVSAAIPRLTILLSAAESEQSSRVSTVCRTVLATVSASGGLFGGEGGSTMFVILNLQFKSEYFLS